MWFIKSNNLREDDYVEIELQKSDIPPINERISSKPNSLGIKDTKEKVE